MINFCLPNFNELFAINNKLHTLYRTNPEYFNLKNISFTADYTLPYFYWSDNNYNNLSNTPIYNRAQLLNLGEIGKMICTINCGNPLLIDTDYLDVKCNAILETLNNGSNKILINTPQMLQYINNKYPGYYCVAGPLYHLYDPEHLYLDKIHSFRATPAMIKNNPWYQDIPKNKMEVCIFSPCQECSQYNQCVIQDSTNRLMFAIKNIVRECSTLTIPACTPDLITTFIKEGYTNFYFDTRVIYPGDYKFFIKFYSTLLIKPEYQEKVESILQEVH